MRLSLIALFLLSLTFAIADPDISNGRSTYRFGQHHLNWRPEPKPKFYDGPRPLVPPGDSYPASSGKSGNVLHQPDVPQYPKNGLGSYPAYHTSTARPGLIHNRNVRETYNQQHVVHPSYSPRTIRDVHHYNYNPPQRIKYESTNHPVYQGQPPVYVYEYRNSGSRFDILLTGLALYNLGRNSNFHNYGPDRRYNSAPGEVCLLRISKGKGKAIHYEETRIDCDLMSSFIWDDTPSSTQNEQHVVKNTAPVTVTQTVNGTGNYSVTTKNSTVEDALNVKDRSIKVTPDMTCSMIRTFRDTTTMRRSVECGLLQEYARKSLQRSGAQCLTPLNTSLIYFIFIIFLARNVS